VPDFSFRGQGQIHSIRLVYEMDLVLRAPGRTRAPTAPAQRQEAPQPGSGQINMLDFIIFNTVERHFRVLSRFFCRQNEEYREIMLLAAFYKFEKTLPMAFGR